MPEITQSEIPVPTHPREPLPGKTVFSKREVSRRSQWLDVKRQLAPPGKEMFQGNRTAVKVGNRVVIPSVVVALEGYG